MSWRSDEMQVLNCEIFMTQYIRVPYSDTPIGSALIPPMHCTKCNLKTKQKSKQKEKAKLAWVLVELQSGEKTCVEGSALRWKSSSKKGRRREESKNTKHLLNYSFPTSWLNNSSLSLLGFSSGFLFSQNFEMQVVRIASHAGSWYTSDRK